MADISSYKFPFREVAELLIRKQGITSGLWLPVINFGVGNVSARSDQGNDSPGLIIGIEAISLVKVEPGSPQANLSFTIDASTLAEA